MAEPAEKPCDWHVHTDQGAVFCEAGPEGHDGGHIGERPQWEYIQLLETWTIGHLDD